MRRFIVAAVAASSMLLVGGAGSALAQDPPVSEPPAEFAPPAPGPVVDTESAGAFAKLYVVRNSDRLSRERRERVRVLNVESSCLQAPFLETRYGCVFTLRAAIISRRGGWDWGHGHKAHKSSRGDDNDRRHRGRDRDRNRRFRVRFVGCIGALRVDAGPPPSAQLQALECRRIQRDDEEVVAPVAN